MPPPPPLSSSAQQSSCRLAADQSHDYSSLARSTAQPACPPGISPWPCACWMHWARQAHRHANRPRYAAAHFPRPNSQGRIRWRTPHGDRRKPLPEVLEPARAARTRIARACTAGGTNASTRSAIMAHEAETNIRKTTCADP